MKKRNNSIKALLFLLFFPFSAGVVLATPTLTLIATDGVCLSDCKITANASNTTGLVTYWLIDYPNPGDFTLPTSSNVFDNLEPGTYKVGVYDESTGNDPVIATAQVNTAYVDMSASAPVASRDASNYCSDNGTLSIIFQNGKAPFTVKITNQDSPNNSQEITVTATTVSKIAYFSGLPSGRYAFQIIDDCGQGQGNIPGQYTTVNGQSILLSGTTFTSLTANLSNLSYVTGVSGDCNALNVRFYYSDVSITPNTGSAFSFYPDYGQLKFRIQYPAGSTNYTSWVIGGGGTAMTLAITDYNRTQPYGDKYIVQVQHPCTNVITSSPIYTLPEEKFVTYTTISSSSYCANDLIISYPASGFTGILTNGCGPYTIVLKNSSGATIDTKTTPATGAQSALFTVPAGTYSAVITKSGFSQTISNIVISSTSVSGRTNYSTHETGYCYYYQFCNYSTTGIYASISNPVANQPVTYTIAATETTPAITRTPIELTSSEYLWTDLPYGTYNVTANYGGGCGSYTTAITLPVVSGFNASATYETYATVCGRFSLVGDAYFHREGVRIASLNGSYGYWMLIVEGPEKVGTRKVGYSYSYDYRAIIDDLPGGTYKVLFYPYYASVSTHTINGKSIDNYPNDLCNVIERTIVIPEYVHPVINIPLSGGISCSNGTTKMTITASGTNSPFMYRYKVKDANDNTYTPTAFQSANVFPNIAPGSYTVQVKDQCGSITTQDVSVFNGSGQFVGIIGDVTPGVICQGRQTTLTVFSIGPVQTYAWFKSATGADPWTTLPSTSSTYVIASADLSDVGYYKVRINNSSCNLESQVHIIDVLPPAATPTITGGTTICPDGGTTTLTANTSEPSPSFQWYKDGDAINNAYSSTYTVSAAGSYRVTVTPSQACPSDLSAAHVMTVQLPSAPTITPSSLSFCQGGSVTLTANPNISPATYTWYRGGVQVATSSTTNTYSAGVAGIYTVMVDIGCSSPVSAGVTLTEAAGVTPTVSLSANPGFSVCENNTTQIIFSATSTNGGAPVYVWKINGEVVGDNTASFTLNNLKNYRNATVSCSMTSTAQCAVPTVVSDTKSIRVSSCVIPANPHIRGRVK